MFFMFLICEFRVPETALGHCWVHSLTNLMLITEFLITVVCDHKVTENLVKKLVLRPSRKSINKCHIFMSIIPKRKTKKKIPEKNFLYFPKNIIPEKISYTLEWNPIRLTIKTRLKKKLFEPNGKFLILSWKSPQACLKKAFYTQGWLLIKGRIKRFLKTQDDCWFSQPTKPNREINKFAIIFCKNDFLSKVKVSYSCPRISPTPPN